MNKVYTLHDAVAKFVEDGDCISFGGFTTNRKPYAVVGEILRQGQKDFTVWAGPAGGDWDMLIGEGRVKAYINCYTANSGYTNVSRRFRAAIEKGELTYEDYSQDVLMLQLHAASLGLPFLPVRLMQGSGLVKYWGISEEQRKALDKVDDLKCVEIENPFEPGQKVIAVPVPKLDECVSAVVWAPYGAWPSQCYNYYDNDSHALKEYDKASKYQDAEDAKAQLEKAAVKAEKAAAAKPEDAKLADAAAKARKAAEDAKAGTAIPETFKDYLDKWVYSVKDNDELLDKIGGSRLMRLKNEPHLGYSTRH